MVERIDDGGAAFPIIPPVDPSTGQQAGGFPFPENGMSLRDWFAGHALVGILAGGFADTVPHDDVTGGGEAAFFAYQYADAMLAARSKTPEA